MKITFPLNLAVLLVAACVMLAYPTMGDEITEEDLAPELPEVEEDFFHDLPIDDEGNHHERTTCETPSGSGICQYNYYSCLGTYVPGYCPLGNEYQCCVRNSVRPPSPPPSPPPYYPPPSPPPSSRTMCTNAASGLNIRSGPGTTNTVRWISPNGQQFSVLSSSGSWFKIRALNGPNCGDEGYAMGSYLRACTATSARCPSPPPFPPPSPPPSGSCSAVRDAAGERSVPCTGRGGVGHLGCCCNFYVEAKIGLKGRGLGATSSYARNLPNNGWCRCPRCQVGAVAAKSGHTGIVVGCSGDRMTIRGANQGCYKNNSCTSDCGCDNINNWTLAIGVYQFYHPSCC